MVPRRQGTQHPENGWHILFFRWRICFLKRMNAFCITFDNFKAADRPCCFQREAVWELSNAALRRLPQEVYAESPLGSSSGEKTITVVRILMSNESYGGMGIIMKQRKTTSVMKKIVAAALTAMLLISSGTTAFAGKTLAESTNYQEQIKLDDVLYNNNYYGDYEEEKSKDFSDVKDAVINVDVNNYTAFEGQEPEIKSLEGKDNILYIGEDNKSVSWEITVEEAGFYQMSFEYLPVDGNSLPVSRGIMIDGEYIYDELSNVKFLRHYVDSSKPKVNNLGDEVRPSQVEIQEWTKTDLYDAQGEYTDPLKVALTAGKHTIKMVYIDQPIAIAAFSLNPPQQLKSYAEVKAGYEKEGYKNASKTIRFEAEDKDYITYKTDSSITIATSSDSTLTPVGITSKKYNHLGASSWGKGNQEIKWKFTVEESGLYQLAPRYYQGYGDGLSSTRQIKIDGEVPFEEWNEVVFTFDEDWHTKSFADENGNPYLVYLEAGEHTVSMRVVMGQMTEVIHIVTDVTSKLSNAIRNITMITGQEPDLNYDYRLERQIPSLLGDLGEIVEELKQCNKLIDVFAVKTTPIENNFKMSYELLEEMIAKPSKIPAKIADLSSSLTNIGTWLSDIKSQCFALDYIQFTDPEAKIVSEKSTLWDSLYAIFANFILSYQKDYNAIGHIGEGYEDFETIEVWVSRSKEQCEILKDITDSTFGADQKINVKISVLPAGALGGSTSPLLLSINAGNEPDVVLGLTSTVPVDYAIRNALYDLTKFDDFDEVKKYTLEEAFVPVTYEGGIYAMPETIAFNTMFYRTDIFEQLDMDIPDTWNALIETLLPQLYQYNMQFYMPNQRDIMVFQNDADYYTETGYTSLVDSPEFMEGFGTFIKMFTDYGCPVSANFLNRFRSGEMPIGVGGFDMYLQLVYAAPELTGKWAMVPLPATVLDDGSLNRSSGSLLGTCASILSTTEHAEAAWEFVKWYTGKETQVSYCRQIESIMGIQARICTANIEAFKQLPWSQEELEVIQVSFDWAESIPSVLGGYYTERHLANAYNRCIIEGQSIRESLEEAAEEINKELKRKQQMYNKNPEGLE